MNTQQLRDYFVHTLKKGSGYQQQIVFSFLCEAAEEAKGGVVLDVGAGRQRYKPFFDESIYIAQDHPIVGQRYDTITEQDILSDSRQIPLRDGSVDLILSTVSLEHMEFPDSFFAESFRVLKSGGALYINVPFVYPEHDIPYDFQRPTRYGLRRYYSHAGFERITVSPTSSSIYTAQHFFLYAMREDGKRLGRAFWAKAARRVMYFTASIVCQATMRLFDKGPLEDTTFSMGWIAKGYKKGMKDVSPVYRSKRDFIDENAQCDSATVLRGGRILPR